MSENITAKYRPKTFGAVIGQPNVISSVTGALKSGIIPPAYLLCGMRGVGKTTVARLIAMSLNCKQKVGNEPCGICKSCQAILNKCSEMLLEVDGATKRGIDPMKEIIDFTNYIVEDGSYRVIVIDECHMLTPEAWNASLKTVEEPPPNILFAFCTTELHQLKSTVLSRCVMLQFQAVDDSLIIEAAKKVLTAENVEYDEKALTLIAKYSNGSIRDSQSIMEGFIRSGKVSAEKVKALYQPIDPLTIHNYFSKVITKDPQKCSFDVMNWIKMGVSPAYIVTALMEYLTDMLLEYTITDNSLKQLMKAQKEKIGVGRVVTWIDFLYTQLRYIRDFPMSYSLLMNIITIKLSNVGEEEKEKAAKEEKESSKEAPKTHRTAPASAPAVSYAKIQAFVKVCRGEVLAADKNMAFVTLKNEHGTVFDVVGDASVARSPLYILAQDIDLAMQDYPNNMEAVVKTKE